MRAFENELARDIELQRELKGLSKLHEILFLVLHSYTATVTRSTQYQYIKFHMICSIVTDIHKTSLLYWVWP